jgi:hypothetical protein
MKARHPLLRTLLWVLLATLILSALVGAFTAATVAVVRPWVDPGWWQGVNIWIDGERLHLPELGALDTTESALAAAVLTGVLLLVLPLALLLTLGGLLLGMAAGTLALLLVLALCFSPLLLLGWLLWLALRQRPPANRAEPTA